MAIGHLGHHLGGGPVAGPGDMTLTGPTPSWHIDQYVDQPIVDTVPCWMCGDLIEVEYINIRNMMGERLVTDPQGSCDQCKVNVNPPSPEELLDKARRALEALGPLGWWWWLD